MGRFDKTKTDADAKSLAEPVSFGFAVAGGIAGGIAIAGSEPTPLAFANAGPVRFAGQFAFRITFGGISIPPGLRRQWDESVGACAKPGRPARTSAEKSGAEPAALAAASISERCFNSSNGRSPASRPCS